ncbi:Retrovirus-related Pol polyprotein from transposon [Apostichopus japonicus]|uniref:Retrovirus-related Pol polyprotein from transposon n=1 Tax=Stichopus japonicus TaxID=307972 RepID=A0A2G8KDZ7_STIJA|nr:Retrovirus-related Pol polyprotein from transposon [Apostichopus japonicus]
MVSMVTSISDNRKEVPEHVVDLLEIGTEHLADEQRADLVELLKDYADVFARSSDDLGYTTLVQHKLDTGSARPVKQSARRVPVQLRDQERELLKQMLDTGVIEPSASPWASPIVLVKKKNGGTRFCVDYRKVNALTEKDSYPIPRIADSLDAMTGARWFSTLDLASGYWQTQAVFDRFREAGLKLSPSKCKLFQRSVTYLGHVVSSEGVATDPEKIKAVSEWPRPQRLTDVRSFVGLCGYYRRFIRGFAEIASPLFKLTEKKQKFDWDEDCELAFSNLKTALTTARCWLIRKQW